ncbi:MAG: cadherin-like domain-containing protein, partial [Planctomycetota bacterium]|nr:cadherin-like domain-containing protein [Planctomycetota bacterium]
ILGFVVPADGVYTVKITTAAQGTYGLLVARDLTFGAEPNDSGTLPLRPLDATGGALGAIDRRLSDVSDLAIYVYDSNLYVPLAPGTYAKKLSLEQFQAVVAAMGDSPTTWHDYFANQYPGYIPGSNPDQWILMIEDWPNGDWDFEDLRVTVTLQAHSLALHFAKGMQSYTYALVDRISGVTLLTPIPAGKDLQLPCGTPDTDDYQVALQPGTTLDLRTSTPGDGERGFGNTLDPRIEVYGPTGLLLAWDDNSAPDGRNAGLIFTAPVAGTYQVCVVPSPLTASPTIGEYVLTAFPLVPNAPALKSVPGYTPGTSNTIPWSPVLGAIGYRVEYDDDPAFEGFSHYAIYRSTSPGVDPSDLLVTTISNRATLAFEDTSLNVCGQTYYYRAQARGLLGDSGWSAAVSSTQDATVPTAPTNLTATGLSASSIQLDWSAASDPESGIDHYNVYRNGVPLTTRPAGQMTFVDSDLTQGATYFYEVSAVNGAALEGPNAGVSSTPSDITPPTVASAVWLWENYAKVVFAEPVEAATAQIAANYVISCANQYVKVLSAVLQSDYCTVLLTTTDMDTARSYAVVVNNVRDRAQAPNTIAANTTAALAYGGLYGQDIGVAAVPGSQSYAGSTYTISASGAGLTGTTDGFYYAYRLLPVDGEIIVRVDSMPAAAAALAGIMVRSSLAPDSAYVSLSLDGAGGHGRYQYRATAGGTTSTYTTGGPAAPYYLKLTVFTNVTGRHIYSYIMSTAPGSSWLPWRSSTLPYTTDPYYVGLAATTASSAAGAFAFSGVQTNAYYPLPDAAPAGAVDSYSTPAGATLTVPYTAGVLVNDGDSDGNSLSAAVSVNSAHGTLSLAGNGAFTYTPAPGYSGPDSFVYTLDDGHGLTQTATVNLTVADTIAPVATVGRKTTDDATPSLTGTVDDPTATIAVTVGGQTYPAVNNGDGTWTLADDVVSPALGRGVYDVQVTATDDAGNHGADATTNELIVYKL